MATVILGLGAASVLYGSFGIAKGFRNMYNLYRAKNLELSDRELTRKGFSVSVMKLGPTGKAILLTWKDPDGLTESKSIVTSEKGVLSRSWYCGEYPYRHYLYFLEDYKEAEKEWGCKIYAIPPVKVQFRPLADLICITNENSKKAYCDHTFSEMLIITASFDDRRPLTWSAFLIGLLVCLFSYGSIEKNNYFDEQY